MRARVPSQSTAAMEAKSVMASAYAREASARAETSTAYGVAMSQAIVAGRSQRLALGAALATVTFWSSAFVGIRAATPELSAGSIALGRALVGSLVLGAVVAVRREPLPGRRDLGAVALIGVLWFCLYNVALNEAERRVDAGTAAMLVNTGPIFIALIAGTVLDEGYPRKLLAGCAVGFAGALVIGLATSAEHSVAGVGALLCIAAALSYAIAVVIQKPVLGRASALGVTWLGCTVGAIACLPFAPALPGDLSDAGAEAIAWTVYLGVVPTALGFTTWAYALSHTTAGRMGATTYLVPPLAVLLGWIVLGETQPALALLGGALCLGGVVLARRG
jgi:drug/metabolite transporter (DMT)-like permease